MNVPSYYEYPTIPTGTIIRQSGGYFQAERTGLARQVEKFIGNYSDLVSGQQLIVSGYGNLSATRTRNSPNPFFPSLWLFSSKVSKWKGGLGIGDYEYRGLDPALNAIPPPIFSLDRSTSNEPLSTHIKWQTNIAGTPSAPLNGAIFVDPITGAASSASNAIFKGWPNSSIFYGVDNYLLAGQVWTETYVSYNPPTSSDLNSVGFLSDNPTGNPPTPQGFSWIYLGLKFTDQAGLYRIDKSWRAFQNNAASKIIYKS